MSRRTFSRVAAAASLAPWTPNSNAQTGAASKPTKPMLGTVAKVSRGGSADATLQRVHSFGLTTCQIFFEELSLEQAKPLQEACKRYEIAISAVSEHNPGPRVFDFDHGPETIGIVPERYRRPRADALKRAADFAGVCGVPAIHTHLGFIPENRTTHSTHRRSGR